MLVSAENECERYEEAGNDEGNAAAKTVDAVGEVYRIYEALSNSL